MSSFDEQALLAIFREEAREGIDELGLRLQALRENRDIKQNVDAAFRVAHNLKGAARAAGQGIIESIAHALEDVLADWRKRKLDVLPADAFAGLMESLVLLEQELRAGGDASGTVAPAAQDQMPLTASGDTPVEEMALTSSGTVRVDVARLDALMAGVGELLVLHARQTKKSDLLQQFQTDIAQALSHGDSSQSRRQLLRQYESIIDRDRGELQTLGYLADELSSAMRTVRMLPLSSLASQWRSTVRECAHELGREVTLTIDTGGIELDRFVLDQLRDPIQHLLRNAVDHGVGTTDERVRLGKSTAGHVVLRARSTGGFVELDIADDGAGIDVARVARAGQQQGLLGPDVRLDDLAVLDLLFRPGFSTAASITRVSGRGVGLDVVKQRVEALRGSVQVEPAGEMGGAVFRLRVPVSLVTTQALLIRLSDYVYAIPIDQVARTLRVAQAEVAVVEGGSAIVVADEAVRLRWMSSAMGVKRKSDPKMLTIVQVDSHGVRTGFVVDEIIGVEEFVTKPLPWNLERVPGVVGAMILGDGTLAAVVDPRRILESDRGLTVELVEKAPTKVAKKILVVDDSLTSRTLERNILASAGYEVFVAVDGEQALQLLRSQRVDLVVSDVEMPKVDGLELTRRIRADAALRHLPIVLSTSLGDQQAVVAGATAGANEYIVKGQFEQRQLLDAVARHI